MQAGVSNPLNVCQCTSFRPILSLYFLLQTRWQSKSKKLAQTTTDDLEMTKHTDLRVMLPP